MKSCFINIVVLNLILAKLVLANPISTKDVQQVAENFIAWQNRTNPSILKKKSIHSIRKLEGFYEPGTKENLAYIVSLEPKGFFILSTETDIEPIIAYSFQQDWSSDTSEVNVFYHLLRHDMKMRKNAIHQISATIKKQNNLLWQQYSSGDFTAIESYAFWQWPQQETTSTGGWIETTWHQASPYNDFCPIDPHSNQRSVVGCVATAMAQIVNYHRDIGDLNFDLQDRYTTKSHSIKIDSDSSHLAFPSFRKLNHYLQNIQYNYKNKTKLSDLEIATLNFTCGILVKMNYSSTGSGTNCDNINTVFMERMDYFSAEFKYPDNQFYHILKENMMNGYPAELIISKTVGFEGHAVICDGYNTNGFFHLNFGWASNLPDIISNAWYLLPEYMGADYNVINKALVNIKPSNDTRVNLVTNEGLICFPPITIGEFSNTQKFILSNIGQAKADINSIVTPPNFLISIDDISYSDSLGSITIPPGDELCIFVQFRPDSFSHYQGDIIVSYTSEQRYLHVNLLGYGVAQNSTIVNGGSVSGIWHDTGSPYIICEDVIIEAGERLDIRPGSKIIFLGESVFDISSDAQLVAIGTEEDSIFFQAGYPGEYWLGLQFENSGSDDTLAYCVISHAQNRIHGSENRLGGAIFVDKTSPTIVNTRITRNKSLTSGSAIFCKNSNPMLSYCHIEDNTGDAIYCYSSSPVISNCKITKNNGSGLYLTAESKPIISNTIFCGNKAERGGAIICFQNSSPIFINVSIINNKAIEAGGGICLGNNNYCTFKNSIIWANQAPDGSTIAFNNSSIKPSTVEFTYSNIDTTHNNWISQDNGNVIWGPGNISEDPLFCDLENNDFTFRPGSPCIDSGDQFDNVGEEPFPHGYRINMGAYGGTKNAANTDGISLTVMPDPVDFRSHWADEIREKTLFLKNGCAYTIQLTSITCSDTLNFSILDFHKSGMVLEPGSIDSIRIRFSSHQKVDNVYHANIVIKANEISDITIKAYAQSIWGTYVKAGPVSGFWTKENSPYNVYGDISIPEGKALTIGPGTTIRFMDSYGLYVGVNAQLRAIGDVSDSVRFCALDTKKGWYGIHFKESGKDDILAYCEVTDMNSMHNEEGGITCVRTSPTITNSQFTCNKGSIGGAIFCENSSLRVSHSRFDGNIGEKGGAIYGRKSSIIINHCEFLRNIGKIGGALYLYLSSSIIESTLICENKAEEGAAIVFCSVPSAGLINVTISHNEAVADGASIWLDGVIHTIFRNSILWAKGAKIIKSTLNNYKSNIRFQYSDIDTASLNRKDLILWKIKIEDSNICQDPLFSDAQNHDFHLLPGSPCIDAGNPDAIYSDKEDPINPGYAMWPSLGTCRNDIGAYGGGGFHVFSDFEESDLTPKFKLSQNYPNPFNPETNIEYQLPKKGRVRMVIYNILGEEVVTLIDRVDGPGAYKVIWNGKNTYGQNVSNGIYIYKLETDYFQTVRKMIKLQ